MAEAPAAPLVLTAELDPETMAFLDEQRRRHFPAGRNHLAAHLTLFHALPGEQRETVEADLRSLAGEPLEATVDQVVKLGRGVAYRVDAPQLVALRRALARRWEPWLTPQDRGWGRPHVTVQNKVDPAAAAALHAELSRSFTPWPARVEALRLWRYLGGPWAPLATVALA